MPKLKTHKGTAKRVRLTKKKKIKRGKAFAGHILTKKSAKRKRKLKQGGTVSKADERAIKRLLGKA